MNTLCSSSSARCTVATTASTSTSTRSWYCSQLTAQYMFALGYSVQEVKEGLPHLVVIVELGSGGLPELLLGVTFPGCCCWCPPGAAAPAAGHIPELRESATTPTCLCRPPTCCCRLRSWNTSQYVFALGGFGCRKSKKNYPTQWLSPSSALLLVVACPSYCWWWSPSLGMPGSGM